MNYADLKCSEYPDDRHHYIRLKTREAVESATLLATQIVTGDNVHDAISNTTIPATWNMIESFLCFLERKSWA